MIDLIYPYGRGSVWAENELRYSIRSVEMYLKDIRNIYVIGKKPSFFNDKVIEIPHVDIFQNKARNIMTKIHRACRDERISDEFMVFNDDYFCLKPFSAKDYPFYYKCGLTHTVTINPGEYKRHAKETLDLLVFRGLNTLNFDSHYPILYNKEKFKEIVESCNWEIPFGYIAKSLYCNSLGIEGIYRMDCKISGAYQTKGLIELNKNREIFSIADKSLNSYMKQYILGLYPNKSSFEK